MGEGFKTCSQCAQILPVTQFNRRSRSTDGLMSQCNDCRRLYRQKTKEQRSAYMRAWIESHQDEIRAYRRAHRAEKAASSRRYYARHPGERKAYNRRYAAEHTDQIRTAARQWRVENRDRFNAKMREWVAANPDKVTQGRIRRLSRIASGGPHFTWEQWASLCERYENRCICCRADAFLQPDHVIPLAKGGSNSISNIQPLCRPCNAAKRDRIIDYRT